MTRFTLRNLMSLAGAVLAGALFCASWNGSVSSDPVDAVYQWIVGIVFGGLAGAACYWVFTAFAERKPPESTL
jgi:hypothetical protein